MARDAVAEVRDRTEIVDLVSNYVQLRKTGRSYKGLCPFHQEKTPSFVVFPESGNFHCFGCGRGGDVFTFYMGVERVEFREALQELAKRAGIELVNTPSLPPEVDAHRNRLIELNELAATYYANVLRNTTPGVAGLEMLAQRGVSAEIAERLGWASPPTVMPSAGISTSAASIPRWRQKLGFSANEKAGATATGSAIVSSSPSERGRAASSASAAALSAMRSQSISTLPNP